MQYYHLKNIASGPGVIVAVRTLLQVDNITAELRGDLLFISPCIKVIEYKLRQEDKCYDSIPIQFDINGH